MGEPTQTGSFWICPDCRKHVSTRAGECRCGFTRGSKAEPETTVNLHRRQATKEKEKPNFFRTTVIAVGGASLVALALSMSAEAWWRAPAKDTELARRLRERREGPAQPPVIHISEPSAAVDRPSQETPEEQALLVDTEPESVSTGVPAEAVSPAPEDLGTPSEPNRVAEPEPLVTETDRRRNAGVLEFERAMGPLAAKADQADIAWERYLAGCRQNITTASTSSVAVAGMASRDWIGIVGAASTSSVSIRTWTEACSEAGTFFALYDQVKRGMCVAEDTARRASVYPGTRREIRTRHRLDWAGWDAFCR